MATLTRVPVLREVTKDRQGDKIQQNAALAAKALNNVSIQPGVLVSGLRFVPGANTYVTHGLRRVPNGYILCNVRADPTQAAATAAAGCQRNTTADPNNHEEVALSLGPFQPFLADVWVY